MYITMLGPSGELNTCPSPTTSRPPLSPNTHRTSCPGALLEAIHLHHSRTEPFYARLTPTAEEANDWRTKGWEEKGQWRFMGDFGRAVRVLYRTFGVQLPHADMREEEGN